MEIFETPAGDHFQQQPLNEDEWNKLNNFENVRDEYTKKGKIKDIFLVPNCIGKGKKKID